jgi:acetoacetyl-CoA synthetase
MMYNWLISGLAVGATIVLYDGSPMLPTMSVLWDLIDELKITMFGTSAKWLAVIEEKGCIPKNTHKLDSLNFIFSTGSPLKPNSFDFVYNSIKSDLVLGSITGGTDIISLFCGHNVNLPVYRGEIQCRHLGMAVECFNEDGNRVYDECGDLVCVKPFPSMPVYFHNDSASFGKYKQSYFQKYKHVWTHGDFCVITSKTGGVTMLGRSDGTLNPNGVRFGSADIYNVIEPMSEIFDSLCVGQKNPTLPSEERVVLFLKLNEGVEFNKTLVDRVKAKIRADLSPRHVPNVVLPIAEIPYTLNGKKVEVPVRRIIEGEHVSPSSSLVNPKCLDLFKNIDELQKW